MAIYEVFGKVTIGSEVEDVESLIGAKNSVEAIKKLVSEYSESTKKVKITAIRVWGTDDRKGTVEYDPTMLCECHSSPSWKCPLVLHGYSNVSIESDGLVFNSKDGD